ncbi:hypothetical protein NPIL_615771 [Nephila pilipes]|uniref:Uncharacterized protein n=1 Tax=Nephila pilipes TaxID=299642 RepID=A0A8X6UET8_NEPPI|nr:hypothetical protein NPIL_615771 [Nephila pilipes]
MLNLPRGESGLTISHVISSMHGKLAEKYGNSLLEARADPNKKDDREEKLHYASYNNIRYLIKAGPDSNQQDSEIPLHCAAGIGDEKNVNAS